jgi:hypothetical protein
MFAILPRGRMAAPARLGALAFALVAVTACSDLVGVDLQETADLLPGNPILAAGSGVTFRAEFPGSDEPGSTPVRLVLSNGSTGDLGYNLCFHTLERRTGDAWAPVNQLTVCTAELRTLVPGAQATFDTNLPPALEPGTYRYRVALHLPGQGGRRDQVTALFEIGG